MTSIPSGRSARTVWSPPAPGPVEEAVRLACRAPSVHNSQPWLWRLDGDRVHLFADPSRQLRHTDPDGRDLVLSCGAALHQLQVAARGLGWRPDVRRLPDPDEPAHLATITLTPSPASAPALEEMRLLGKRQTDRRRYTSWPVPPERLAALAQLGDAWGARVVPVRDEVARRRLRQLTRRADEVQRDDPGYLAELERQVRPSPDGLAPESLPVSASGENRTFPVGALDDPSRDPIGEPEGLLLVCTAADDRLSRLRAGETMSAVWLGAVADGLSVVPLSQALEVAQTRSAVVDELLDGWGYPQIVLRIGWPPIVRADLPLSRRRDLDDVLVR